MVELASIAIFRKDHPRLVSCELHEGVKQNKKLSHAEFIGILLDGYEKTR